MRHVAKYDSKQRCHASQRKMKTPPKRLRRLPHWGRRLRPGKARSAAAAGVGQLHAARVARSAMGN